MKRRAATPVGPLAVPEAEPAAPDRSAAARVLPKAARLAVAGGLTAYILWKSHPRAVVAAAAGAAWPPLVIAVLLVFADRVLMAYRWVLLLCTVDRVDRPPLIEVLRIFFVSTFVGTFLPSVGGDAVRAYSIAKLRVRGGDAVASVFMDRMLGVASLLLVALAGLLLARDLARNWVILASLAAAGAVCLVTLLLVFSRGAAAVAAAVLSRLPGGAQDAGYHLLEAIQRYAAYHGELATVLAGSLAVQALRIAQAYYIGQSLGIEASVATYVAFVPLILLVMLLPVTISGLGTGQAAFLWFFGRVGVMAPAAFALSAIFIALGVVGNLPGAILYAGGRHVARTA